MARGGKKLDKDTEALINYAGYVLLMLVAVWLFTRDLDRLGTMLFGKGADWPPM